MIHIHLGFKQFAYIHIHVCCVYGKTQRDIMQGITEELGPELIEEGFIHNMLEQISHTTHMCGTYALVLPNLKVQLPLQDHHAKLDIKIEMETIGVHDILVQGSKKM